MEISDALKKVLDDIDPHVRVEIEIALAAKRVLEEAVPADMVTWGLDRWRYANERQRESIDRLLDQLRHKTTQHREVSRLLAQESGRLGEALAACRKYDGIMVGIAGQSLAREALRAEWSHLDPVTAFEETVPR